MTRGNIVKTSERILLSKEAEPWQDCCHFVEGCKGFNTLRRGWMGEGRGWRARMLQAEITSMVATRKVRALNLTFLWRPTSCAAANNNRQLTSKRATECLEVTLLCRDYRKTTFDPQLTAITRYSWDISLRNDFILIVVGQTKLTGLGVNNHNVTVSFKRKLQMIYVFGKRLVWIVIHR